MLKTLAPVLMVAGLVLADGSPQAMPFQPAAAKTAMIVQVADGCGPGRYRGPGGACHPYGRGPYPNGYYGLRYAYGGPYGDGYVGDGCAPGWWRGPWGHCRHTPYHGPLPGGGWQ